MRKTVATKWADALRSGKYKKGSGFLKQIGDDGTVKHCCLGVLCEVYNEDIKEVQDEPPWTTSETKTGEHPRLTIFYCNGQSEVLPKNVQQWADMKHSSGRVIFDCDHLSNHFGVSALLSELNDSNRYSFSQIADIIEKNVEVL